MAYHEYESWKTLPYPGGLYDQPYEWKRAVETVRAAHLKAQAEDAASRRRAQAGATNED